MAYDVDQRRRLAGGREALGDGGYAHKDAMTVTGRTFAEEAAEAKETPGQEVIRAAGQADQEDRRPGDPEGQPRARRLRDQGGRDQSSKEHRGPARVFEREEDAMAAVTGGKIKAGDVVVIRYEGPRGGPGHARNAGRDRRDRGRRAWPKTSRC